MRLLGAAGQPCGAPPAPLELLAMELLAPELLAMEVLAPELLALELLALELLVLELFALELLAVEPPALELLPLTLLLAWLLLVPQLSSPPAPLGSLNPFAHANGRMASVTIARLFRTIHGLSASNRRPVNQPVPAHAHRTGNILHPNHRSGGHRHSPLHCDDTRKLYLPPILECHAWVTAIADPTRSAASLQGGAVAGRIKSGTAGRFAPAAVSSAASRPRFAAIFPMSLSRDAHLHSRSAQHHEPDVGKIRLASHRCARLWRTNGYARSRRGRRGRRGFQRCGYHGRCIGCD